MENNDRLTGIEACAKALGWDWGDFVDAVSELCSAMSLDYSNDNWHPVAERILSLYEPGPVVEVKQALDYEQSCESCDLCYCIHDVDYLCILALDDGEGNPSPDCPGAGTFKLIPVEVPDAT